jgi:hypothetical protein
MEVVASKSIDRKQLVIAIKVLPFCVSNPPEVLSRDVIEMVKHILSKGQYNFILQLFSGERSHPWEQECTENFYHPQQPGR